MLTIHSPGSDLVEEAAEVVEQQRAAVGAEDVAVDRGCRAQRYERRLDLPPPADHSRACSNGRKHAWTTLAAAQHGATPNGLTLRELRAARHPMADPGVDTKVNS
jgi:hypothetical protein